MSEYPGMPDNEFLELWLSNRALTIAELAKQAGVNERVIKRILEGKAHLIPAQTQKILTALGLQVVSIQEETEEPDDS